MPSASVQHLLTDEIAEGSSPADIGFIDLLCQIVFFLSVAMIVYAPLAGIGADTPVAPTGTNVDNTQRKTITLSCDREGRFYMQGKLASAEAITQALTAARAKFPEMTLVIEGDRRAQYGKPFRLLECAHKAGFDKAVLQTAPSPQ